MYNHVIMFKSQSCPLFIMWMCSNIIASPHRVSFSFNSCILQSFVTSLFLFFCKYIFVISWLHNICFNLLCCSGALMCLGLCPLFLCIVLKTNRYLLNDLSIGSKRDWCMSIHYHKIILCFCMLQMLKVKELKMNYCKSFLYHETSCWNWRIKSASLFIVYVKALEYFILCFDVLFAYLWMFDCEKRMMLGLLPACILEDHPSWEWSKLKF